MTAQPPDPLFALSIQQPWAGLIVAGLKDIENRTWRTNFRGRFMIHAGKAIDRDAMEMIARDCHPVTGARGFVTDGFISTVMRRTFWDSLQLCGGIVGQADITDCGQGWGSDWYVGPWGFRVRYAVPVTFVPMKGQLGFFKVPPDLVSRRS